MVNFQATAFEAFNLKMSVLTACAYVSLCLGDYVVALEHATALLNLNKLPEAHRLLGHLYAAESLIYLNRIDEAIEYLKIDKLQDLNTNLSILDFNNALSLPGSAKRSREKTKDPPKLFKRNEFFQNLNIIFLAKFIFTEYCYLTVFSLYFLRQLGSLLVHSREKRYWSTI